MLFCNPSWNGCQNKALLTLTKVRALSLLQFSHLWQRSRRREGIAPFALDCGQFHQRSDRLAFVIMGFDHDLAPVPNPAPLANETCATKKVALNAKPVEAAHVASGINPPQVEVGWKDFELHRLIEHIVIQLAEITISGRIAHFYQDFLSCRSTFLTLCLGPISRDLCGRDQKCILIGRPTGEVV